MYLTKTQQLQGQKCQTMSVDINIMCQLCCKLFFSEHSRKMSQLQ